jgi:hypothetical protein
MRACWMLGLVAGLVGCSSDAEPKPEPDPAEPTAVEALLPASCGHAHNDYEHDRPLLDALDRGFCSVEVDVFLVGDALLVAHAMSETDPARTIENLYLDPLRDMVDAGTLSAPASGGSLILLIDVKSNAEATYAAMHEVLEGYQGLLTRFEDGLVYGGPVTALISGNRDRAAMEAQDVRYAALDGRVVDFGTGTPLDLMPLVSQSWQAYFDWQGPEPMPADQLSELEDLIATAHGENRRMRLWASPDNEVAWQTQLDAGLDLINSDDLSGLSALLDGN